MEAIDWRDLYASNRAAIEQAGVAPSGAPGLLPGPIRGLDQGLLPGPIRGLAGRLLRGERPASPGTSMTAHSGGARVHVPAGLAPGVAVPLICMLHGCTQDAASFAAATRMDEAADRHGFVVLYPEQDRGANPQGCWNWFRVEHQARGHGEPAAIAALVRELVATGSAAPIDPGRVFVAGLSAGGAMAAILAATHPDLFAGLAVHSGLAYGAAADVRGAFAAMAGGGGADGHAVHRAMGRAARPVATMVVHGSADRTVAPVNAEHVLAQWMAVNELASSGRDGGGGLDPARPPKVSHGVVDGGHRYTRSRWTDARGALLHERLEVEGMGHAWSGGTPGGSYTDPRGPDATESICRFFAEARQPAASPEVGRPLLGRGGLGVEAPGDAAGQA